MKIAIVTLSSQGARLAGRLTRIFRDNTLYIHESVDVMLEGERFASVVALTGRIFNNVDGLVYIAPCGAVVRAIAGVMKNKKTDPAVVVMDVGGRHAISLLSGHEGGANALAMAVANAVGAEPVITTTTEAVKNLVVGVGLKRGKSKDEVLKAIKETLDMVGEPLERVRLIASADIKSDEPGLISACESLGVALRFISSDQIRNSSREFAHSEFVKSKVNLPAVAEPSALLAGRRTTLIQRKTKHNGVTVAVARENCTSLG